MADERDLTVKVRVWRPAYWLSGRVLCLAIALARFAKWLTVKSVVTERVR